MNFGLWKLLSQFRENIQDNYKNNKLHVSYLIHKAFMAHISLL